MIETEVKIHWQGTALEAFALIESKGYTMRKVRTLEIDQIYDRGLGELREAGKLLRLRRTGSGIDALEKNATITYKGPAEVGRYKSREEIEFFVDDAENCVLVLDRLGYQPAFRYEKFRTMYWKEGEPGVITVDETPMGVFVELEGGKDWIDSAAERLGAGVSQYITASYASLYREYRQGNKVLPPDMVFPDEAFRKTRAKLP